MRNGFTHILKRTAPRRIVARFPRLEALEERQLLTHTSTLWPPVAAVQPLLITGDQTAIPNRVRRPHQPRTATVSFQTSDQTTFPGGPAKTLTITANPAPASNLTVTFTLTAGSTAQINSDFSMAPMMNSVIILAGHTTADITITPLYPGTTTVSGNSVWVGYTLTGVSNTSYSLVDPKTSTVTISPNPAPPIIGTPNPGAPGLFPGTTDSNGGNPALGSESESGIRYGNGQVDNATGQIMDSTGFGQWFGQALQWSNITPYSADSVFGLGMVNSATPSIHQTNGNGYMVVQTGQSALWFDPVGSGFQARFFENTAYSLRQDATGDFTLIDARGNRIAFNGFGSGLPVAQRGTFKSLTDPYGNVINTKRDKTTGQLMEIQRSATVNGVTTSEVYGFSYVAGGSNAGLVQSVSLQRQVNGGTWSVVRKTVYDYYDGTQAFGNARNLRLETIEDGSKNILDQTYFRYYTANEAGGYAGGLKYRFGPAAYARLVAVGLTLATAADTQVSPFADAYYEYDKLQRVTLTTVQGAGISGTSQTTGTYKYSYKNSTNATGFNTWATQTVETLPDGNTNTVYTNFAGEVMVKDFLDQTDPANTALQTKHWYTFRRYDSQGRLLVTAEPSAVTGYSDTYPDLMNFQSGKSPYLADSTGVFHILEYGTSPTATSTAAGDVTGYAKDEKIQVGESGTAILLTSQQYFQHANNNLNDSTTITIYPEANASVYRTTDVKSAETTSSSYSWLSGSNGLYSTTISAPVISAAQNGSNAADITTTVFDTFGQPVWTKDADGYIHYAAFDVATGAVVRSIVDVNTNLTSLFTNLPSGWTTPTGGGLNLMTQMVVDALGRPTKVTDPNGNINYRIYNDPQHWVRAYNGWTTGLGLPTGPTIMTRADRAGSYLETLTMAAPPNLNPDGTPNGTEPVSNLQFLSRSKLDNANRLIESDRYFSLGGMTYSTASFHLGELNKNYYASTTGYDRNGNPQRVQNAVGTITDTLYDSLNRPTAVYVGTNDSTTDGKPWTTGNAAAASNMAQVSQAQYDGNGAGDSNLTQSSTYVDATATNNRVTQFAYDGRDRLVATKSGVQANEDTSTHRPILYYDLDNLGEVIATSQFDGDGTVLSSTKPATGLLRAYATTAFDDQGRPDQTQQFSVNQDTGAVSTYALTTNLFYNHRGNTVAIASPGGLWTKDQFDGAGRVVTEAQTDGTVNQVNAPGTAWEKAQSLTYDLVLTQTNTSYDANSNPILITTKDRFHNDLTTEVSPLGNASTNPKARVSYASSYYDAANRVTASVDVGTNGGVAYVRPTTVPASSDTTLVTSYGYSLAGWVNRVTDPRGIVTQSVYDALGRPTQTVQNSISQKISTAATNVTTLYGYNGIDQVVLLHQVIPSGSPSQITQYTYGVTTAGGSALNSNDLLAKVSYPDPVTGVPSASTRNQETFTYNRAGDTTSFTDPNGSVHAYSYDVLARLTSDAVTTLGTGVDGAVRRRTSAYNALGLPFQFTTYNAASGGSIVNQVQDAYNGLGQLTAEYQAHGGAVDTTSSPSVRYAYNEMADGNNNSRLVSMTYPNGRKLDYVYNAGLDSSISRVSSIAEDNAGNPGTILESYFYLGLGTIVEYDHPEPKVNLTYIQRTGQTNVLNDGGDIYTGLDRFGRVIDQNWWNTNNSTSTDRFQYGYDRDSQALFKKNLVAPAQSELYHANSIAAGDNNTAYDGLGQLTAFARGTLSASGKNGTVPDTVSTPSRTQSWNLDTLGNWSSLSTNSTTTNRTFNAQNQTATVNGVAGPGYDSNGNTTSDVGQTFVFDAWNHLVAVKNAGVTVAAYSYDALARRLTETYGATTNHLYYSSDWQVIEERQNATAVSNLTYQYVWGLGGVNQLVLRDGYSGGNTQRLYAQWDTLGNITSLISSAGVVQERYLYDPYGSVTVCDAAYMSRPGNASSYAWKYLFQGNRIDTTTGWYGVRNRDYIPGEGRWAERDPLSYAAGDMNLYRFVGNGPTYAVDTSGLFFGFPDWIPFANWPDVQAERGRREQLALKQLEVRQRLRQQRVLEDSRRPHATDGTPEGEFLDDMEAVGLLDAGGERVGGHWKDAAERAKEAIAELPERVKTQFEEQFQNQIAGAVLPTAIAIGKSVGKGARVLKTIDAAEALENGLSLRSGAAIGIKRNPRHHIFPQEMRSFFAARGFNDIDKYTLPLDEATHQALHKWMGSGPWNEVMRSRILAEETKLGRLLSKREILDIGAKMRREAGLSNTKIIPFKD